MKNQIRLGRFKIGWFKNFRGLYFFIAIITESEE